MASRSSRGSPAPVARRWLAANDAPRVRDTDAAMWRRILRVPFEHTVPRERRDPRLKADLTNPKIAGPAILSWMVRGCIEWQRAGLGVPASIDAATEAYRADMNPLGEFFTECCEFDPDARVPRRGLFERYERWAKESNVRHPLSQKSFAHRVTAKLHEEFGPRHDVETRARRSKAHESERAWRGMSAEGVAVAHDDEQLAMPS